MDKKRIVLSGANITSGGPLEIFRNILNTIVETYPDKKIVAIVNSASQFSAYPNVEFIEIGNYKKFILLKFYYEYFHYYRLSKKLNVQLWFSLNDCSPTIIAEKKAVYCHNPSLFYHRTLNDYLHPSRPFLQSFYYGLFYRINIHKNDFIVVQQEWLKRYFGVKFNIHAAQIIVNRPVRKLAVSTEAPVENDTCTFIYPTKPEYYKNLDVIVKACAELEESGIKNFKVILTIDGTENGYAKSIVKKAENLKSVQFVGKLPKAKIDEYYSKSSCLIFSSVLETWGLPITEFQQQRGPVIVSDLPFARETVGYYDKALFFNPYDYKELKYCMLKIINKNNVFDLTMPVLMEEPFAPSYTDLLEILLK